MKNRKQRAREKLKPIDPNRMMSWASDFIEEEFDPEEIVFTNIKPTQDYMGEFAMCLADDDLGGFVVGLSDRGELV